MTNISDPNATEMRGWVMLMLERAAETVNPSECNDPAVLLACSLGSDSCPAACQKDADETTVDENGNKVVVKSGDLSISATAAEGKKVVKNGISDLDTITLRASEAITLNSVSLERYGLSSYEDVKEVWLENANGERISQGEKSFNSKDVVTLTIKKDYRTLESEDTISVVIETTAATGASSIGVKVTGVESSAKNLDISNYSPYLYDVVAYTSSTVTIVPKGKATNTYHYVEGNSYEIGRFQVKAGNAAILVNGFTLKNIAGDSLDLDKYLDNITITLSDGTAVKNVKFTANKDDELKASFDGVSIGINKNAIFVIEATFKNLDKYNKTIELKFDATDSLNVQEEKSWVRAKFTSWITLKQYTFQGGKIEVANEKLSENIDASAGSSDVVIGKGKITLNGEAIELSGFVVKVTAAGINGWIGDQDPADIIQEFRMKVNGEELSATKAKTKNADNSWNYTFGKINVDETSNVEFVLDLNDSTNTKDLKNSKLTFWNDFDKTNIANKGTTLWKYVEARSAIELTDFAGSISLSNVRIQAARGSLTNTAKDVEFLEKQSARKTIFDGTYTAQKQDLWLNEFAVNLADAADVNGSISFYLSIDGKEVASQDWTANTTKTDADFDGERFTNILIKQGEKVSVKIEANVNANEATLTPTVLIKWEDKDGNTAGFASETAGKIKIVKAGSVTVSESAVTPRESVLVNDSNVNLARFTVKSSKNTEGMSLKTFKLEANGDITNDDNKLTTASVRVRVAGQELVPSNIAKDECAIESPKSNPDLAGWDYCVETDGSIFVAWLSEDIPSAGVDVEVIKKTEFADLTTSEVYAYTLKNVNGSNPWTKFTKKILRSIAYIKAQDHGSRAITKFTFGVDKDSKNNSITNVVLYTKSSTGAYIALNDALSTVEEGSTVQIQNEDSVKFIDAISWWETVAATYHCVKGWAEVAKTQGECTWEGESWVVNEPAHPAVMIKKADFRDFFKVGSDEAFVNNNK